MSRVWSMRSINARLGVLTAAAVGSAMVVVAGTMLWQDTTRYLDDKRDGLLAAAAAFSAASADPAAARDQNGVNRVIRGIGAVPGFEYAALKDARGVLLAEIGSGVRLSGDLDLSATAQGGSAMGLLFTRTVSVTVPVRKDGATVAQLSLVSDLADLWPRLRTLLTVTLLGGAAALVVGLLIALRLQRSITRPLIALTEVMSAIETTHDYTLPVAVTSDDEVGVLARSFASMLGEVQARDAQLVQHRDRLEQDVDERTRDLALAKADAEAANVAKSDFLATMSHEIRTPMNGMLVMAELLAGAGLPERQRRYAEVIARSGQSLMAIINDILDFSKIEAGKLTFEQIAFSPAELADTVITLFAERAATKALDLAASVAIDLPATVIGDPVRVTQVLSNLVNNALKFTERGHVLVTVSWADGMLGLSVSDSGIGIPADKLPTIFSAFSQADQSTTRRFGGTGLGLSICKRIVDAMGGAVDVRSQEGRGTTFAVRLPAALAEAAAPMAGALRRPVVLAVKGAATDTSLRDALLSAGWVVCARDPGTPHDLIVDAAALLRTGRGQAGRVAALASIGDGGGEEALRRGLADTLLRKPVVQAEWRDLLARLSQDGPLTADADGLAALAPPPAAFAGRHVLVVDDSMVNREVACAALARLEIAATAVDGGRAALAALEAASFDLVLMDGSMPDLDGYETTRLLREAERRSGRPPIPVIALTAHVVGAAAVAWRSAGMDDVLHKPFTLDRLADILRRHLSAEPAVRAESQAPVPATATSAAGSGDLLDEDILSGLAEMTSASGSSDFAQRILGLFATDAPAALTALGAAVAERDETAVAAAAHKLRSMSLNVGASRLAAMLSGIEHAAREDGVLPPLEQAGTLQACLDESVVAIRRYLDLPVAA